MRTDERIVFSPSQLCMCGGKMGYYPKGTVIYPLKGEWPKAWECSDILRMTRQEWEINQGDGHSKPVFFCESAA